MMNQREHVVKELVESERIYYDQLNLFIRVIVVPLREEKILTNEAHRTLFSNIETIAHISSEMVEKMREISLLPLEKQSFGRYFSGIIPLLKGYSIYCTNAAEGEERRRELQQTSTQFKYFLQMKNDSKSNQIGNNLESYLIKPVQRITKLPLLIKELLKSTDPSHLDYEDLRKSFELLTELVNFINEKKRTFERKAELVKILENLKKVPSDFVIIQPHRVGFLSEICLVPRLTNIRI